MSNDKTVSLSNLAGSQVSGDGNQITLSGKSAMGGDVRICMTPELAAAFIAELTDACRRSAKNRDQTGSTEPADEPIIWNVDSVVTSWPSRQRVRLRFNASGAEHHFEMTPQEAATLADDLNAPRQLENGTSNNAQEPQKGRTGNAPSALNLPLVHTSPIRTGAMTDFPDGLALELGMQSPDGDGSFKRVRIPMFADTARAIVGALTQALQRIDEDDSSLGPGKFS